MTTIKEQSFEEAIAEYIARCKESVGFEREEGMPPGEGTPYPRSGPPFVAPLRYDERTIKAYATSVGDTNPLFRDPEYARNTRYGALIAPNQMLILARSPGGSGPQRPQGYPVGDFFSGLAWEFYTPLYVGTGPVSTTKKTSEFFEKNGSQGHLLFLIEEIFYWDGSGKLIAKCYGTLILVPMKNMGGTRAMSAEKVGESLMYTRKASQYTKEDFERIDAQVQAQQNRRGSNTLYWEDVQVGDKIGPYVIPPWTLQDQIASRNAPVGAGGGPGGDTPYFEGQYYHNRERFAAVRGKGFVHPATQWPWGPADEHADALTAAYRGQALPFDGGQHRAQLPHQMIASWMGDDGFVRRHQCALRRPVYYSDVTQYTGEVVKKFTEEQDGENKPDAVPGKATYHAVGIKLEGTNQVGQTQMQGSVTVYLPSRAAGPVQLPIPHKSKPPYVPYEKFYRDWYQ